MTRETMDMKGQLHLELLDRDGQVCLRRSDNNRIVENGRLMVARMFAGDVHTPGPAHSFALGTSSDKTRHTSLELGNEVARKAIDSVRYEPFTDRDKIPRIRVILGTTFDYDEANSSAPLREAAIFHQAGTSGPSEEDGHDVEDADSRADSLMYNRVVFPAVLKNETFRLRLSWEIVF